MADNKAIRRLLIECDTGMARDVKVTDVETGTDLTGSVREIRFSVGMDSPVATAHVQFIQPRLRAAAGAVLEILPNPAHNGLNWIVGMPGGPVLAAFRDRSTAVAWRSANNIPTATIEELYLPPKAST